MAKTKIYEVTKNIYGLGRTRSYTLKGTLDELIKATRYTFEVGQSYNSNIKSEPKTIKSFIANYKKALKEQYNTPVEITYQEVLD